ncbi:unnamed protein product [Mucor fragilis]
MSFLSSPFSVAPLYNQRFSQTMSPITYITRSETFSAAHRLHSPQLSNEDNQLLYGKCNHPHFHGHNYKVEITLKGEVDPVTGMVMNLVDLKECIKLAVMDPLDHRNLDLDVEFFKTKQVQLKIWHSARLHKVKIFETEHNMVEYLGEGELDEAEGQVDVALIKLMGVGINHDGLESSKKSAWSLDM